MLNMFKTRKVATYKATVDMQIEEWADVMGNITNSIRGRHGGLNEK